MEHTTVRATPATRLGWITKHVMVSVSMDYATVCTTSATRLGWMVKHVMVSVSMDHTTVHATSATCWITKRANKPLQYIVLETFKSEVTSDI